MANISVILGHPDNSSFNHAIANRVVEVLKNNNYHVFFHDLYAENFQPSISPGEAVRSVELPQDIKNYCDEIGSSDGIIIVHPNWWGQPPAVLKGWVDRVLRADVAYRFLEGDSGEGVPEGLLKAKTAIVFNTSNTPVERELKIFGDPLETIWKNCIFGLCGVNDFYRKNFGVIVTSTPEQRSKWLNDVAEITVKQFPQV